ncbi:MAG TPA: hypothetical protein VG826_24195 [Pirellulales bacterium]|nr:hypothetical protein [Pirellulales bacterium]
MSNATDDSTMRVDRVLEVTGKKTYETALGAGKTVLLIEPFDVERMRPFLNGS